MTPSERERRLNAAAQAIRIKNPVGAAQTSEIALDAADEAVPMVSQADSERAFEQAIGLLVPRLERAEAAVREFARALRRIAEPRQHNDGGTFRRDIARAALRDHPSFSGEEGTER